MTNSLYAGKILKIDLSNKTTEIIETSQYTSLYLGGRGIATALYYKMVPPTVNAFDEKNCIIIANGPLAGIPGGLGGSRWGVYCKTALPRISHREKNLFCHGNLGGTLGAELKFAGYDGIVITGKSNEPVYIEIEDENVNIKAASNLWGLTTHQTIKALSQTLPEKSKIMTIGPAGENLVPFASIIASGDSSASGGTGAVMGSKNLKAIAVKGSKRKITANNTDKLKEIEALIRSYNRGNTKVWGMDFMAQGKKTKKYPCFGCMAHCLRIKYTADNGTSGKYMCQSRFFYMHHAWGYYGKDNDVPFYANQLCDAYGVDTWEIQSLIEWLLLVMAKGLLTEKETQLSIKEVGSLDFIKKLIYMTATKTGFGKITQLGAYSAGKQIGGKAKDIYTRTDPYDPRYCTVNTLLFPFESREPIQQLHEAGLSLSQWSSWAKGVQNAHISSDVISGIAERFWGSKKAADMTTLKGKAMAAKKIQERQIAKECAGFCDWMFPIFDIPTGKEHIGDPTIESKILSAALNKEITEKEYYKIGERVFNLQRAIMLREGHKARKDDYLPPEWHNKPIETHVADPECLVPGKNGIIKSQIGRKVEINQYKAIRDQYYEYRGWDIKTGLPSKEKLIELGLSHIVDNLNKRQLIVDKAKKRSIALKTSHTLKIFINNLKQKTPKKRNDQLKQLTTGPSLSHQEIIEILEKDAKKYIDKKIAHNFSGWTKKMQYHFTDINTYYKIEFINGIPQQPQKLDKPLKNPEIAYEMDTRIIKAMSNGKLTGEQAYLKRLLRLKAPFTDMMKLQALNKL